MPKNMFAVKAVSTQGDKKFYREVGVAFLNESEKGKSIKIALHMHPGLELVAFPVEKAETPAGE